VFSFGRRGYIINEVVEGKKLNGLAFVFALEPSGQVPADSTAEPSPLEPAGELGPMPTTRELLWGPGVGCP